MRNFYTINYKLIAKRRNDFRIIDVQTFDLAYKSRENAFKAVQEQIKTQLEVSNYKPTRSQFVIETEPDELGLKFVLQFEIKEHWLSDFEQGD